MGLIGIASLTQAYKHPEYGYKVFTRLYKQSDEDLVETHIKNDLEHIRQNVIDYVDLDLQVKYVIDLNQYIINYYIKSTLEGVTGN